MTDEEAIQGLLEEMMESGSAPERVCADRPDLLPEVRRRWRRMLTVSDQVDALFPIGNAAGARHRAVALDAPRIPGYEGAVFIGRGGMGVVYRAHHTALGRAVAIKMLLPGMYESAEEPGALVREASAVAALQHPNILQVFEVGMHEGRAYFTMEYLEGGSLAQRIAGVPQPPRQAAELMAVLADAVQVAHEGGIVHRDLKPGNILFTGKGVAKVADFSLAHRMTSDPSATIGRPGCGTPSYMAPEQAMGGRGRSEPPVDVYALGAVLYDLLTGRAPFRADTPAETHRQVIEAEPAPPSKLNARVPRDLETICLKCLAKEPSRRYASARALAEDLRRFLEGRPIVARRAGAAERAAKWARRHPSRAALTLVAVLLVSAGGTWAAWAASERAVISAAVNADLDQIVRLQREGRFGEASGLIERARARLADSGSRSQRERLVAAAKDLELVAALDAVRMDRAASSHPRFDPATCFRRYEGLLRDAGLIGAPDESPELIAARIRASPVSGAIIGALNDWAVCSTTEAEVRRTLDIARLADPDPAWRDRMRDMNTWRDAAALRDLARTAPTDPQSAALAPILAAMLVEHGDDPIELFRCVQAANPSDFWANFRLAECLDERFDPDAIGFYRAARALRPDSVAAIVNLGTSMSRQGRWAEAETCWLGALDMDPDCAPAALNLGFAAINDERPEEAADYARRAASADPSSGMAYMVWGDAAGRLGQWDEAIGRLERAIELLPQDDRQMVRQRINRFAQLREVNQHLEEFLDGSRTPADTNECFAIGDILMLRKDPVAAMGYFVDGFALTAGAVAEATPVRLYGAACVAALASVADEVSEPERAACRRHCLEWLRASFAKRAKEAESPERSSRWSVRTEIQRLKEVKALAPLRDEAALAAMEDSEEAEWRAFWKDVDALVAALP